MALNIGNKVYRTLQEQVGYNTECIKKLAEAIDGIDLEDKLVTIENDTGSFTEAELVILSAPLAFISNGSRVWIKDSETLSEFVYKAIDIKATEVGSAYFEIGGSKIVVNRATGVYNTLADTIIATYSKLQIDSIVSGINSTKADKTELNSGLALKANISGQAFTGAITAPSIIENMSGYSWQLNSSLTTISVTPIYAGVVKNGNKLTLVLFAKCVNTSANSIEIGRFTIPEDVAAKLYPYQVGSSTSVLSQQELEFFPTSDLTLSPVRCTAEFIKSANDVVLNFRRVNANLVAATEYTFRLERTFLLSENLAA